MADEGKPLTEALIDEYEREIKQDIARSEYRLKEFAKIRQMQAAISKKNLNGPVIIQPRAGNKKVRTMELVDPDTGAVDIAVIADGDDDW